MLIYTPRLGKKHSDSLRRLSWAFNIPMTTVLSHLIDTASIFFDKKMICKTCKDKLCSVCIFQKKQRTKLPGYKLKLFKSKYCFTKK